VGRRRGSIIKIARNPRNRRSPGHPIRAKRRRRSITIKSPPGGVAAAVIVAPTQIDLSK